jgi:Cu/Zn superoxide dismutase
MMHSRLLALPALLLASLLAGCGAAPRAESLGRMGGTPPTLQVTAPLVAGNGAPLGEAVLLEESGGDRLVLRATGLPEGRHRAALHARARCTGQGFADAGPALAALPPLEVDAAGQGDLFADLPARLRGSGAALLDDDGLSVLISIADTPIACAAFRPARPQP